LDFVARLTAEYLSRSFGQQFLVENKVGAGGTIGVETAAKSPPDGYSILVTNDNVVSAPHILKLTVNYLKDLVPVAQLARQALALAVHPSLGVSSLQELISTAKQRGALGCATSGVGSNQHVLLEWFNQIAGVKLEHVPYRGAGQAINDLIAGHVLVGFLGPTALIPHYKAGTLRLLAQSSEKRSTSLPEIPTLQEAGFNGLVLETWYGAFVPAATPPAIIARLNAEMGKALADAATRKSMLETATEPVGGSADQFARLIRADSEKYERLAKELRIKVE
jgi:tripartite-type tricarboxylate transporter receptor subunit TctC